MITPLFKVDQDEKFIYLKITIKYVKFSDVDFFIEGNNFRLYLKPYHLNLHFSDNLKSDSENNHSKYDVDKGLLECKIEKELEGVEFKNLELISTLFNDTSVSMSNTNMSNTSSNIPSSISKKVEEISIDSDENFNQISNKPNLILNAEILQNEDLFNEYLIDSLVEDLSKNFQEISLSTNKEDIHKFGFGFNNEFFDVFKNREEERMELLDLNPYSVEIKHRFFAKMEKETEDFVPERFVYDEILLEKEDEGFEKMLKKKLKLKETDQNLSENTFSFSEKELNMLKALNKTKLSSLDLNSHRLNFNFYLEAVDILIAILYDYRTTDFEHNSESGWTINKLSSVFSCCVDFNKIFFSFSSEPPLNFLEESVTNVLISSYRRILCYPLYRNLKICHKIKEDLSEILSRGIFHILKIFLRVKSIFERSEPRHILNKIYVDMFIKWLQFYSNEKIWVLLGKIVNKIQIEKRDLKMDLEEYEKEFELQIEM